MIEVLWFILLIIAGLVALLFVGVLVIIGYFVFYSLYCLVFNKPNKLDVKTKLFDSEEKK